MAYRVDLGIALQDFNKNWRGSSPCTTSCWKRAMQRPGQVANEDTFQIGGTADVPVTDRLGLMPRPISGPSTMGWRH